MVLQAGSCKDPMTIPIGLQYIVILPRILIPRKLLSNLAIALLSSIIGS